MLNSAQLRYQPTYSLVEKYRELPMAETTLFHRRPYQAFLSHAHADKATVDYLSRWLTDTAGLAIWYDAVHLPAGARIATELGNAMAQSKAAIIVLSQASVASGWVEDEWNIASNERNRIENQGEFRIIPVRIERCEVPRFLGATKFIDLADNDDQLNAYADLLVALYEDEPCSHIGLLDIYVSRTWREGREQVLADQVCKRLAAAPLRLIGDSPDWPNFEGKRIRSIMSSCNGVVSIVPDRRPPHEKLKYFLKEISTAHALGLPLLVVAEAAAELPDEIAKVCLRVPREGLGESDVLEQEIAEAIQELMESCRAKPHSQHMFLATDLDEEGVARIRVVQKVLQRVTGLPCIVGERISGDGIQKAIVDRIHDALAMIADISGDSLNICIEAGIARGAGVPVYLVAQGARHSPPFMLRDIEPAFYQNDIEFLGAIHRIARPYRRKVLTFSQDW
jgi:hypothetical protein